MYDTILINLGKKIYNYFLENTTIGEPFILLIEPSEYERIKEKTGNINDVNNALKSTENIRTVPRDYISIAVANLQVQLIYSIAIEQINDSFYTEMKNFYPKLKENNDVMQYFENFQEEMWEKVRDIFAKKNRLLQIPEPKKGSGRYVQFPKSQRLITWNELSKYADSFIKINLKPHQVLSFFDFCSKVYIGENYNLNDDENEIIKKIIFSFYCKWDGSSSEELKIPRQRENSQFFTKDRRVLSGNKFEFTIRFENDEPIYYFNGKKVTEQDVKKYFINEKVLSFLYDEEYEDWIYTTRSLHRENRLITLVDKSHYLHNKPPKFELIKKTEFYYFLYAPYCDNDIKEYFTITGGIKVIDCYHFRNDVLGAWYDFALPKIKLNLENIKQVFIDSNEIFINDNIVDLSNLMLKANNEKMSLTPGEKVHSLKCANLKPVYFLIRDSTDVNNEPINNGWKLSSYSLCPIKLGELSDISGLFYCGDVQTEGKLRSFLLKKHFLQNRLSNLNINISKIERRRIYGI